MSKEHEKSVYDLADKAYRNIISNRCKILEAFIAETGYKPSEIEQVIITDKNTTRYFLRRKKNEL